MTRLKPHTITLDPDDGQQVLVHPASVDSVLTVFRESIDSEDGRSGFMWVRLPNGDLVLGVYPQGDTYFAVEVDAQYPRETQ